MTAIGADGAGAWRNRGVWAALGAALLFGAGTPAAKMLLGQTSPWLLAGLLYLGSGLGLTAYRIAIRAPAARPERSEVFWLAGAIFAGGVVAPVLMMAGLAGMSAVGASLLLNAEAVFTTLIAWFVFRENFDRRIAVGMLAILAGAAVLSWPSDAEPAAIWPSLAVLGACLCWGIDNNLTRKVALNDAAWIASLKGTTAGLTNLLLAFSLGAVLPSWDIVGGALVLGLLAYGVSLTLFIVGLRHLGAARTGAYFSVAPFFGAVIGLGLGDPVTLALLVAGALMVFGVWLHLTETHAHLHTHTEMEHEHLHEHDEHHLHEHPEPVAPGTRHLHLHRHEPLTHSHAHFPDLHHDHSHK